MSLCYLPCWCLMLTLGSFSLALIARISRSLACARFIPQSRALNGHPWTQQHRQEAPRPRHEGPRQLFEQQRLRPRQTIKHHPGGGCRGEIERNREQSRIHPILIDQLFLIDQWCWPRRRRRAGQGVQAGFGVGRLLARRLLSRLSSRRPSLSVRRRRRCTLALDEGGARPRAPPRNR